MLRCGSMTSLSMALWSTRGMDQAHGSCLHSVHSWHPYSRYLDDYGCTMFKGDGQAAHAGGGMAVWFHCCHVDVHPLARSCSHGGPFLCGVSRCCSGRNSPFLLARSCGSSSQRQRASVVAFSRERHWLEERGATRGSSWSPRSPRREDHLSNLEDLEDFGCKAPTRSPAIRRPGTRSGRCRRGSTLRTPGAWPCRSRGRG